MFYNIPHIFSTEKKFKKKTLKTKNLQICSFNGLSIFYIFSKFELKLFFKHNFTNGGIRGGGESNSSWFLFTHHDL